MTRYVAKRPVTGYTLGGVPVPVKQGSTVTHVRGDVYELRTLRTVSVAPAEVSARTLRVTLNPMIAATDLEELH